jgi:periplasmic divalent cation tolerance protein
MTAHDVCEITITAPDGAWLEQLCQALVDRRLASSAHVVRDVTTIYRWQGAVRRSTEARAFLRSRTELVDSIVAFVVERHPYDIPNITAVPLIGGNPAYIDWVRSSTEP